MKKEEAIGVLRDLWCFQKSERYSDREIREVCEMAIKALKEQRQHGEWKPKQMIVGGNGAVFMHNGYECKCGRVVTQRENFCPECGADMRPREGDRNE